MPINKNRAAQGGDVEGTTINDKGYGLGAPITVAKASFDPGYPLDATLSDGGTKFNVADLKVGFCSYGKAIGERGAS